MQDLSVRAFGQARLDHAPDLVRQGDRVAVQVQAQRRDEIGLGAIADGRRDRLTGEHVRAVKLPADDAVQKHLPVGLRLQRDVQPFFLEKRSEEHTSELQSLMRISYAVFCLKKKITRKLQTKSQYT